MGKGMYVLAVERGYERTVQLVDDIVGDGVAFMFKVPQFRYSFVVPLSLDGQFLEDIGRNGDLVRLLIKHIEKLNFLGNKAKCHVDVSFRAAEMQ